MDITVMSVSEIKVERIVRSGDNGKDPYDVFHIDIKDEKGTHTLTIFGDDNQPIKFERENI
jgi:hypothetical protein